MADCGHIKSKVATQWRTPPSTCPSDRSPIVNSVGNRAPSLLSRSAVCMSCWELRSLPLGILSMRTIQMLKNPRESIALAGNVPPCWTPYHSKNARGNTTFGISPFAPPIAFAQPDAISADDVSEGFKNSFPHGCVQRHCAKRIDGWFHWMELLLCPLVLCKEEFSGCRARPGQQVAGCQVCVQIQSRGLERTETQTLADVPLRCCCEVKSLGSRIAAPDEGAVQRAVCVHRRTTIRSSDTSQHSVGRCLMTSNGLLHCSSWLSTTSDSPGKPWKIRTPSHRHQKKASTTRWGPKRLHSVGTCVGHERRILPNVHQSDELQEHWAGTSEHVMRMMMSNARTPNKLCF